MLFIWDPAKARKNIDKHSISFETAQTVFDDPLHLSVLDAKKHYEERWVTVGCNIFGKILTVVHTYQLSDLREEKIRIISARLSTRKERKQYEEGI